MTSEEPRRKRGRPSKEGGPIAAKARKAAQRSKEHARKDEHPDRVVVENGLFWFETWVHAASWLTNPDGTKRRVVTEGYRRFGEAGSNTAYGMVSKLPEVYRGRATKVLESMGLLPKRTKEQRHRALPEPSGPNLAPESKMGDAELAEMRARVSSYADLSVAERIKEIDNRAGASGATREGGGAGQSTYEPQRTKAATVNDAAHSLRLHGTEIAVGPTATDEAMEAMGVWWQDYLAPYGGGAAIPAKIVRVSDEDARAAVERLAEHENESCSDCQSSPLLVDRAKLTLSCSQCGGLRYVSFPRGILSVGGRRELTNEDEEEAAWRGRQGG